MNTNLLAATVLFLLTAAGTYVLWYLVRGRAVEKRKGRREKGRKERKADEGYGYKEGTIDKDSYCYPKINEAMGFEFVKVVSVDESLRPVTAPVRKDEPSPEADWNKSEGIGTMTLSVSAVPAGMDADKYLESLNEGNTVEGLDEKAAPSGGAQRAKPAKKAEALEPNDDDAPAEESISEEELSYVANFNHDWMNREFDEDDSPFASDDALDAMLDENADRIDAAEPSQESIRMSATISDFEMYAMQAAQMEQALIERDSLADQAGDIMKELERMEPSGDDSGEIEPDDLPDL